MEKAELRKILREKRSQACLADREAPYACRDLFLKHIAVSKDALISAYIATDFEMDPSPLMASLFDRGHKFCLPCETQKGQPLVFRSYHESDVLRMSSWHIPEPALSAPIVVPDVMLVPLVGFDGRGHRLGTGGGFYDRSLNILRTRRKVRTIGLAFACQQVAEIPTKAHDVGLDEIVTEKAYLKF